MIPRAEMLAELMRMKYGVAIGGSHGKTTTTSMTAEVLAAGGLDPTTIVGGRVISLGANSRLGAGEVLVAEADESDGSFLRLVPTVVVITNIDREHLDHYGSFEKLHAGVRRVREPRAVLRRRGAVHRRPARADAPAAGHAPASGPTASRRRPTSRRERRRGRGSGHALRGARARRSRSATFALRVPGRHNVQNALAALTVGLEFDVPVDVHRARRWPSSAASSAASRSWASATA